LVAHIDGALAALDFVAYTAHRSSRVGYFAAVYRKVTAKVKQSIAEGYLMMPSRRRSDVLCATAICWC
jgi:hypothetical protein